MKKLTTTIAAALIMISSLSAFAANKSTPVKFVDSKHLVDVYLAAITSGTWAYADALYDKNFQYTNSTNAAQYSKSSYIKFLKENKGIKYDCTTSYEILDESGQACIAKATMKFKNFTRVDYITLNKSEEGWKVSKVLSTYPQ